MVSMYLDFGAASCAHENVSACVGCKYSQAKTDLELGGPLYRLLKARHCVRGGRSDPPPRLE